MSSDSEFSSSKAIKSKNMIVIYPIPDKLHDDVYPGIDLLDIINQKKEEVSRVRRDSSRNRKYCFFFRDFFSLSKK